MKVAPLPPGARQHEAYGPDSLPNRGDEVTTTWAYDGQFLLHRNPTQGSEFWTVASGKPPGLPSSQSVPLGTKINSSNLICLKILIKY